MEHIKLFQVDDKVWETLMGLTMGRYVRAGIDKAENYANEGA